MASAPFKTTTKTIEKTQKSNQIQIDTIGSRGFDPTYHTDRDQQKIKMAFQTQKDAIELEELLNFNAPIKGGKLARWQRKALNSSTNSLKQAKTPSRKRGRVPGTPGRGGCSTRKKSKKGGKSGKTPAGGGESRRGAEES